MVLRGVVAKVMRNVGTKSEAALTVLQTEGAAYVLRRSTPDANAFSDPVLDQLIGKSVEVEGEVLGSPSINDGVLSVSSWRTLTDY